MKPLIDSHPDAAPWVAATVAGGISLVFALLERRPAASTAVETTIVAVAVFVVVRWLGRPDDDGRDG